MGTGARFAASIRASIGPSESGVFFGCLCVRHTHFTHWQQQPSMPPYSYRQKFTSNVKTTARPEQHVKSVRRRAINTHVAGRHSHRIVLAHGTLVVEDEYCHTNTTVAQSSTLGQPCSSGSPSWTLVSWQPSVKFSRVKQRSRRIHGSVDAPPSLCGHTLGSSSSQVP